MFFLFLNCLLTTVYCMLSLSYPQVINKITTPHAIIVQKYGAIERDKKLFKNSPVDRN